MRFRMYAERVLKVVVWNYQCDFLPDEVANYVTTPDALRELVRVATAHNWRLLPNVHTLVCEDDTPSVSISSHISHLFGPQLRAFRFEHHDPTEEPTFDEPPQANVEHEEDITEMLRVVKMHAPQLVQLEIHVDPSSVSIVKALSDVALSCQSLVSFRCGSMNLPITPGALRHLALLPLLEYLSFTSVDGTFTVDEIRAFNRLPHAETFPRLRSFDTVLVNLDLASFIVKHISSPHLQHIDIDIFNACVLGASVQQFFRALCKLPNIPSLTSLRVRFDAYPDDDDDDAALDPISHDMLRPLLASQDMFLFEVFAGCPFDLNDGFLEDMVRAWPKIINLRLTGYYPHRNPHTLDYMPGVTWNGIITVARGWPGLKELSIDFNTDVSRVPPWRLKELRESNRANGTKDLRTLDFMSVGLSKIHDEMAVATLLSELFTPIAEIDSYWHNLSHQEAGEEQLKMEQEGDAFEPDPGLEARAALYATYHRRWSSIDEPMHHINLIRCQEQIWQSGKAMNERGTSTTSDDDSMSDDVSMSDEGM